MTGAADLVAALVGGLSGSYPTRLADRASVPGRVTCAVAPDRGAYTDTMCDPSPVTVTAQVAVIAAMTGEQGTADLLGHIDPVAGLIRAAGWTPTGWTADNVDETPAVIITCTADGLG